MQAGGLGRPSLGGARLLGGRPAAAAPREIYSFPLLPFEDIAETLRELGVVVTEDDLTKPKPEPFRQWCELFVLEILALAKEDIYAPSRAAAAALGGDDDLHDDSVPVVHFLRKTCVAVRVRCGRGASARGARRTLRRVRRLTGSGARATAGAHVTRSAAGSARGSCSLSLSRAPSPLPSAPSPHRAPPHHHHHTAGSNKVLSAARCDEGLTLRDVMKPERQRVQRVLSALINLFKFRAEKTDWYESNLAKRDAAAARRAELAAQIEHLQAAIAAETCVTGRGGCGAGRGGQGGGGRCAAAAPAAAILSRAPSTVHHSPPPPPLLSLFPRRRAREAEQPEVDAVAAATRALEARRDELTAAGAAVRAGAEAIKERVVSLREAAAASGRAAEEVRAALEAKRAQVVSSPAKVKGDVAALAADVDAAQAGADALEAEKRVLARQAQVVAKATKDVAKAVTLMGEAEAEAVKLKRVLRDEKARKAEVEALGAEVEGLRAAAGHADAARRRVEERLAVVRDEGAAQLAGQARALEAVRAAAAALAEEAKAAANARRGAENETMRLEARKEGLIARHSAEVGDVLASVRHLASSVGNFHATLFTNLAAVAAIAPVSGAGEGAGV